MNRSTRIAKARALSLAFILVSSGLGAQILEEPHQYLPDIEEHEWQEQEGVIPPYPREENLLEFHVDASDPRYRFFIDTESLSIGDTDRVVRYTLVLKLSGGNRSVTYEGMKCSSKEYKTYAFGGRNESMRPARRSKWSRIRRSGNNLYRRDLWEFYLCTEQGIARRNTEEILNTLRYPREDRKDRGFF